MIYLHHRLDRAACETEAAAARLEARGWVRCTATAHRALWCMADQTALAQMRAVDTEQPAGREKADSIVPSGWKVYHV